MGLFDQFPYTNFHELNLDWVLRALKELDHTIEQFVAINALKYADPIQWNITSQYEKNTIVIDPLTGTAYISVQPVPAGVSLSDADYWTAVFNLSSLIGDSVKNLTIRVEGAGVVYSTYALNPDDWVIWNGILYKALLPIAVGTAYVVDTNIKRVTVEDYIDSIIDSIGDLDSLNTTDKSNLIAAINEVLTTLTNIAGDLDNLDTTDKSNLVAAINETQNNIINSRVFANVKEYGAKGDGVTDDTQAFIDCLAENSIAYAPSGIYIISDTIEIAERHGIIGDGKASTILRASVSDRPIIKGAENSTHVSLRDLAIEYNGYGRTSEPVIFNNCGNVKLYSCYFSCIDSSYTYRNAVSFTVSSGRTVEAWAHTIERCTFYKTSLVMDGNTDSQIINNEFNSLELTSAIYLIDGGGYVIADNMIIGDIAITRTVGVQINNNYFDGGSTHPIITPIGGVKMVQAAEDVQIIANRFFVLVGTPIDFSTGAGVHVQIVGNFFQNCDDLLNGLPDIDCSAVSASLLIADNTHIRTSYYNNGTRTNRTGSELTNAPCILPTSGVTEFDTKAIIIGNSVRFATTYTPVTNNNALVSNNQPEYIYANDITGSVTELAGYKEVTFNIANGSAFSDEITETFSTPFTTAPQVYITEVMGNYSPRHKIVLTGISQTGFTYRICANDTAGTTGGTMKFNYSACVYN